MIKVHHFTFSPIQENTYIISNDAGDAIIIDPGCYFPNEQQTLETYVSEHNLTPVQLLNTHCHLDHVFGNKWVSERYSLELFIHPAEEKVLQFAPVSGNMYGLPFDNYEGRINFLNEGDKVLLGQDELQVILAPGHSPGSVCFYHSRQNIIISGDVLFYESIGRTDLPGGNHQQLLQSITTKLFTLPDETVVYCGHGPSTTIGYEKQNNPFLN